MKIGKSIASQLNRSRFFSMSLKGSSTSVDDVLENAKEYLENPSWQKDHDWELYIAPKHIVGEKGEGYVLYGRQKRDR